MSKKQRAALDKQLCDAAQEGDVAKADSLFAVVLDALSTWLSYKPAASVADKSLNLTAATVVVQNLVAGLQGAGGASSDKAATPLQELVQEKIKTLLSSG